MAGRFFLLVASAVVATSVGLTAYFVRDESESRYRTLVDRATILAGMMAENGQYGLYTKDPRTLQGILVGAGADPDFAYAAFLDPDRERILFRAKDPSVPIPEMQAYGGSFSPGQNVLQQFRDPRSGVSYINLLLPVVSLASDGAEGMLFATDPNPTVIGYVQLGLSRERSDKELREFLGSTVKVTTLFLLAGIAVTLLVTRRITTPVGELVAFTRTVSEEGLRRRVPVRGGSEIADLAESFNQMLERLEASRAQVARRTEELSEMNERLSLLLGSMPVVVYASEAEGEFGTTYLSANVQEVTGYPVETYLSRKGFWREEVHPEDAPAVERFLGALPGSGSGEIEYRWRVANGSWVWFRDTMRLVAGEDGRPGYIVGVWEDISRRKEEENVRALLTMAVEQAAESIVITDTKGTIRYVNPAFERTSGFPKEEAIGGTPAILKSGRHDPKFYADLWRTIAGGKVWTGTFVNKRKDGTLYHEVSVISPVRDAAGRTVSYVAVKRDVTTEVELEEQLRQSQKMEAVGKLAGGIAHDFNNLLTAILGYSELLLLRMGPAESGRKEIEEIREAGERASSLTRQLLAFSRKQILELKVVDLNGTILAMDRMLRRVIGEDVRLETIPGEGLGKVRVDPGQIEQVLMNLVVNARDAMPDGGSLTIETSNVRLDEEYSQQRPGVKPGEYVLIAVSDTGCGMDRATQSRIFEPFFTTKEVGKGTGLGLSTVYGIVKQTGGNIWVYSEPGIGTTFKVYLPRALDEETAEERPEETLELRLRGAETLLVAEDEDNVRELIRTILSETGYRVLEAQDGNEALAVAEAHAGPIHLLLTDVVMPRMSGKELADRFRKKHPNTRVLFMSGYTEDAVVQHGIVDSGIPFLQKPFRMQALRQKVREVLDEDAGEAV